MAEKKYEKADEHLIQVNKDIKRVIKILSDSSDEEKELLPHLAKKKINVSDVNDAALFWANLAPASEKQGGLGFTQNQIAATMGTTQQHVQVRIKQHKKYMVGLEAQDAIDDIVDGETPLNTYRMTLRALLALKKNASVLTNAETMRKILKDIREATESEAVREAIRLDKAAQLLIDFVRIKLAPEINKNLRLFLKKHDIDIQIDIKEQIYEAISADVEIMKVLEDHGITNAKN